MTAACAALTFLFWLVWKASWHASLLVVLVLATQFCFRGILSPRARYMLWFIVVARLLLPEVPQSRLSAMNLVRLTQPIDAVPPSGSATSTRKPLLTRLEESPLAGISATLADGAPATPLAPASAARSDAPAPGARPPQTVETGVVLAGIWLLGAVFLSCRLAASRFRLRRLLRRLPAIQEPALLVLLEECKREMGVARQVSLVLSEGLSSPAVTGVLRPTIILSRAVIEGLHPGQLRHLLLHELAHLRGQDVAVVALTSALEVLHWFNPVIWLAFRRMREDRELACDAAVLTRARPHEAVEYGRTAIRLMEMLSQARRCPGTVAMLSGRSSLRRRIAMIAGFRAPSSLRTFAGIALAAALVLVGLTGASDGGDGAKEDGRDLYGDPLPQGALARMGTIRLRHPDWAKALSFSPDGDLLASAGGRDIRLWDAATGRMLEAWPRGDEPPPNWARGVAFSPDGKRLAGVVTWPDAEGGTAVVLRATAPSGPVLRIKVDDAMAVAFSPDGRSLLVWGGSWSTKGDQVVDSSGMLRLLDAASGEEIRRFRGHEGSVIAAGFSSGGKTFASSSRDNTVRLWDAGTGAELRRFTIQEQAKLDEGKWLRLYRLPMACSPDGRWIALSAQDEKIQLRELPSGEVRRTLQGHEKSVTTLAFSPDSRRLASGAEDQSARIWDVETGRCLRELKGPVSWIESMALSADGKSLAAGSQDKAIRIWDVESGRPRLDIPGPLFRIEDASPSPDGAALATAGPDGLRIWEMRTGRQVEQVPDLSSVSCVSYSPEGKLLAAGSWDKRVRLWRAEEGRPVPGTERILEGHAGPVRSLAFSPDGLQLATGGGDGDFGIVLWSIPDGARTRSLGPCRDSLYRLAYSPDGKLLAGLSGRDGVYVWQLFAGGWVREISPDRRRPIVSIAFTLDGKELMTAGEGDEAIVENGKATNACPMIDAIRFWSLETGAQVRKVRLARDPLTLLRPGKRAGKETVIRSVTGLAISSDGAMIASGEEDGRIFIYDAGTGRSIGELAGHAAAVTRLAFSRDGKLLMSASHDDLTALVWDLTRTTRGQ